MEKYHLESFRNLYSIKDDAKHNVEKLNIKNTEEKELIELYHEDYKPEAIPQGVPPINNNYKVSYIEDIKYLTYPIKNKLHFWNTNFKFKLINSYIEIKRNDSENEDIIKAMSIGGM